MTIADPTVSSAGATLPEHLDVVIVGAGMAGIGCAHHVKQRFPDRSLGVFDALPEPGGTWWTHRYPGARTDSDMFTFGYAHKPWGGASTAESEEILTYLGEAIEEDDLASDIHFCHRITKVDWSSTQNRWTVHIERTDTGEVLQTTCSFLWVCAGYYAHDRPHRPQWPAMEQFTGTIIHPQSWPTDLDWTDKRIAVIGSGATAATIVPTLAQSAKHVTMIQRSPSYYLIKPRDHEVAQMLRGLEIPDEWFHEILRRVHARDLDELARVSLETPSDAREWLVGEVRSLIPESEVAQHFTPSYRPWQQRMGVLPDGDLFTAMRDGKVTMVTDTVETFTERGIRVSSGAEIEADIIVSATGFEMNLFGDIVFSLDGRQVDFSDRVTWQGVMISGVPNMAYYFGYLRHSWTMRLELISDLVLRIIEHLDKVGASVVTPTLRPEDSDMEIRPWVDPDNFNAGYVMRNLDRLYRQGDRAPWLHLREYAEERSIMPSADIEDGSLRYV